MVHVLHVGTWPSRSCAIDSAVSNMAGPSASAAIWRSSWHKTGRHSIRWSQRWSEDYGEGFPKWRFSPLRHSAAGGGTVGSDWGLCWVVGTPTRFLRCLPWWPDVGRCIGGRALSLRDDDSAALPPSGVVALSEPDPRWRLCFPGPPRYVGLVWNPPPRPDPSRLDEWFLGGGRAGFFSAPLRCHSFRKCMRSLQGHGRHLLLPEINLVAPPPSHTLDGGAALGYTGIPSCGSGLWPCSCVQQSLPLCGVNRVSPHGPVSTRQASLAVLIGALWGGGFCPHAMALLQVHQAKALRDLHEGWARPGGSTWAACCDGPRARATKVTAQSLGRAMSTLVVQERHLWLCLTDMKEQEKVQFPECSRVHRPAFSATLSRAVPSSFRQHRSRLRRSSTSCAGGNPLLLPLRLQPLSLLVAGGAPCGPPPLPRRGSSLPPCGVVEPVTDRTPSPSRPPPDQAASASARGPETGDPEMERTARRRWWPHHSLPRRRAGWRIPFVSFCFCSAAGPAAAVPKTSIKEQFPQSLGLKRRRVVYRGITGSLPSSSLARQGGLPKSTPPAHLWNRVRAVALKPPLQVVTRKPGSCVSSPHEEESGECYLHTQTPPPAITGQAFTGPGPGSLCSTSLPQPRVRRWLRWCRWHVSRGAWLALPSPSRWLLRTIRLGYAIQFARRPPKFRGIRFTSVKPADAPVLRAENRSPTGEGCDRAGPSSRYEVGVVQPLLHCAQERWWVTTDLGSASFEPCTSQAAVQDVDAETHFWMRPVP